MPLITINNVSKIYGDTDVPVHALHDVSTVIEKGEFTSIVGPSGSGKTTLLNVIGGLDVPTHGEVTIDGTKISTLSLDRLIEFRLHRIGFVFQSYNLIPVLTARENVEFIMLLQKVAKEERTKRALDLLARVGLADRANDLPTRLSGGQQQRVAVARALASNPAFVLADEPTANLDSRTAESLLDLMEELNHKQGMTFVFSTHDGKVIRRAHRVITLEDGHIVTDVPQTPHVP
jgi:putative ABC transport system ATP-binding protein